MIFNHCLFKSIDVYHTEDESILPIVTRFITTQGRMKFVRPLYCSLYRSSMGKQLAVETFLENKDFYHPICVKMVAADLSEKRVKYNRSQVVRWSTAGIALVAVSVGFVVLRRRR